MTTFKSVHSYPATMKFQVMRECLDTCVGVNEAWSGPFKLDEPFDNPIDAILYSEQWRDQDHICWVEIVEDD